MSLFRLFLSCMMCAVGGLASAQVLPAAAPKSIAVVLDDNYPPYIFRDDNGQLQGILKDTWALWQARTGVAAQLQAMDWADAQRTMQAGRADVIDTIFETPERQKLYDFSASYVRIEAALFFQRSLGGIVDASSVRGFTVGVKEGDACMGTLRSQGVDSFKRYASYSAVVNAAITGEVRVFCMDLPLASYLLNQTGVADEFWHSPPISSGEFHRAVRQGDASLLAMVEAGFAQISPAERRKIDEKWLGSSISGAHQPPYLRYPAYALYPAVVTAFLAVALMLWNLMLRQSVRTRTQSLSDSLATLEHTRLDLEQALLDQQAMLNNDMVGIVKVQDRLVVWANPAFEAMLGCGSGELVGTPSRLYYPSEEAYLKLGQEAYPMLRSGQVYRSQTEFVRRDGRHIWVEWSGSMLASPAGASLWTFLDVTERKAADDRLRQLSRSVEQAPVSIVITDLQGGILYVNPVFTRLTGYTLAEALGKNPRILKSGLTPPEVYVELWDTLCQGGIWQGELHNRRKNGELFIEHAVIAPVLDVSGNTSHYVAVKEDITERKQADLALQTSLKEKVGLLHEVHHRVKNNLQVITSLLRLEAGRSEQPETRAVLKEMQGRIFAMALLHESLYRTGTFASAELGAYLKQLATQAFRSASGLVGDVRLVLDVSEVHVGMDQATPCGLLVNELVSNCLKHGFPAGRGGEVVVSSQPSTRTGWWCLTVRDTGVGLPADFDARRTQSLGLQLVSDLARQLGGQLDVGPGPGAVFSVTFCLQVFPPTD